VRESRLDGTARYVTIGTLTTHGVDAGGFLPYIPNGWRPAGPVASVDTKSLIDV